MRIKSEEVAHSLNAGIEVIGIQCAKTLFSLSLKKASHVYATSILALQRVNHSYLLGHTPPPT